MSADRRRHRVFVTRHTEYHLRGDECVGVRDRHSKLWLLDHAALRLRAVSLPPAHESLMHVGQRIQFWGKSSDVLTSPVLTVERPERTDVGAYVSQARAGDLTGSMDGDLRASLPA